MLVKFSIILYICILGCQSKVKPLTSLLKLLTIFGLLAKIVDHSLKLLIRKISSLNYFYVDSKNVESYYIKLTCCQNNEPSL